MVLDCQLDKNGSLRPPHKEKDNKRYVGCREQMEIKRVEQIETNAPDPWISRKLAVGIVVGIFGYSYYVYVVRLCIPMIRIEEDRLGGRAQGVVYLVIFHLLFVLFCWSYLVAILTPPGFARDYVPQSDPPREDAEYITVAGQRFEDQPLSPRMQQTLPSAEGNEPMSRTREGEEVIEMTENRTTRQPSIPTSRGVAEEDMIAENVGGIGALGPDIATALTSTLPSPTSPSSPSAQSPSSPPSSSSPSHPSDVPSDRLDSSNSTAPPSTTPTFPPSAHLVPDSRPSNSSFLHFPDPPESYEPLERLKVERIPPVVPVLNDKYRYDAREGILRPYRSHRCRHCAAVVLKMDHHCPWVGTCVGARNYKYFYNFLQSSTLYCLYLFLTLLIAQTLPLSSTRPYPGIDGQQIAIIVISFFFLSFTGSLWAAHTRLLARNMTTIEEIALNRMRQKERVALEGVYGFWNFRAKREVRRAWDLKWGRLGREGNLWWLGSKRANWEMVMGQNKLGWFLPIEAKPIGDDGLSYRPNPRFDKDGVWRTRKEWPEELREVGLEKMREKEGGKGTTRRRK